jgi:hypothetical protein
MSGLEKLVGRTILEARMDKGSGNLCLMLDGWQMVRLVPEGDCCANCFINGVSGADALQGGKVVSVENAPGIEPTQAEKDAAEVLDTWGHVITTDHGVCFIDMRVSHNGYYGGSLDWKEMGETVAQTWERFLVDVARGAGADYTPDRQTGLAEFPKLEDF